MITGMGTEARQGGAGTDRQGDAGGGGTRAGSTGRSARGRPANRPNGSRPDGEGFATALGWFSIGLGLSEVVAPRRVARLIGIEDDPRERAILRALGVREIMSGIAILSQPRARWVWSRVAGDAMDLALLGTALASDRTERPRTSVATAAVLGVTALDVLCSQRLTRAEHRIQVQRSVTINRTPEEVYQFWRNLENLPRFTSHLEAVRVIDDRRSHWQARAPVGTTIEWDAEIVEDRPNELIAWRAVEGADVPNSGSVRFAPAPGRRGTEVHVAIDYNPPGGQVGAAVAKLFREEPTQQLGDDLRALKQVLETGEVLVSDATVRRGLHPARPDPAPGTT